ncbi:hypothetical protein BDV26DRAFT_275708 [Aspergillus bertholletiae]|uniref:Uncharacterized protein n=1 Tax=Aspergillus bertholletiae TaxID=1226010 RepID=A0A5N7AP52_9EURO|nr:hypothetical protein BDV26DRAFT_275708 [Aspergillus bertholletiae]
MLSSSDSLLPTMVIYLHTSNAQSTCKEAVEPITHQTPICMRSPASENDYGPTSPTQKAGSASYRSEPPPPNYRVLVVTGCDMADVMFLFLSAFLPSNRFGRTIGSTNFIVLHLGSWRSIAADISDPA